MEFNYHKKLLDIEVKNKYLVFIDKPLRRFQTFARLTYR